MDGGCDKFLARLLAMIACLAGPLGAFGEDNSFARATAQPDYVAVDQGLRGTLASGSAQAPDIDFSDLAARVNPLETAVQEAKDREEADKKKAVTAPTVKPFGRIFWDTANFSQNPASIAQSGDAYNGCEFRSARIGLRGEAFQIVDYSIEMDFAGQTTFKDVYIHFKDLPWIQNVRVGHYYEPFGLEAQTSTNVTTFMEKTFLHELGDVGGHKSGVMLFGWDESQRLFWQIGGNNSIRSNRPPTMPYDSLTGNKDDFHGGDGLYGLYDDRGGYAVSLRAAGLVWYDEATEGRGLLEIGASYSYRSIPGLVPGQTGRYRVRSKPESNLAPYVVDTGWLDDTDIVNAFRPEILLIYGPFSVQSEYLYLWLDRSEHGGAAFDGGYVTASYFLTGEHRPVHRSGILRPGRIQPFEDFFRVRTEDGSIRTGKGAWELAYRASCLNLTDAGVQGGRVVDHTFGLNWHLNAYTRVMLNYIHSDTTARTVAGVGSLDALMTRVQVDF